MNKVYLVTLDTGGEFESCITNMKVFSDKGDAIEYIREMELDDINNHSYHYSYDIEEFEVE